MGIIDQVKSLFRPKEVEQTTAVQIRQKEKTRRPYDITKRFKEESDRVSRVRVNQRMFDTDPRAEGVLRMLARDVTAGGYELVFGDNRVAARAEETARALETRLGLADLLSDTVLYSARDGDSFYELAINNGREIVEFERKPTLNMRRNSDDNGRFPNPDQAFTYVTNPIYLTGGYGAGAIHFPQFLIVHARYNHDPNQRYGRPLFNSAVGAWKKVTAGETDISIRRSTRAGMKYNHEFPPGTQTAVIQQYMELNKDALDNPLAAVADFFGTVKISAIQGDAQLEKIADVEHFIQTWSASSPVPIELLTGGANLNRDVLSDKKEQYDETTDELRKWEQKQVLNPLYHRQWLLAGILPETVDYSYQWKAKTKVTPVQMLAIVNAAAGLRGLGYDDDQIWSVLRPLLPTGVNIEQVLAMGAATEKAKPKGDE